MSRALFWIALMILVYFALRAKLRANSRGTARKGKAHVPPQERSAAAPAVIENMTSCAHCGLHFPASEALHADGRDYCSPAHLQQPPARL